VEERRTTGEESRQKRRHDRKREGGEVSSPGGGGEGDGKWGAKQEREGRRGIKKNFRVKSRKRLKRQGISIRGEGGQRRQEYKKLP